MFIILAPGSHLFSCQFTLKPQNFTSQVRLSIKGPSFFKWANPGLFLFFCSFSSTKFTEKNCKLQRDSNSDCCCRRRARPLNLTTMAAQDGPSQILSFIVLASARRRWPIFYFSADPTRSSIDRQNPPSDFLFHCQIDLSSKHLFSLSLCFFVSVRPLVFLYMRSICQLVHWSLHLCFGKI